MPKSSAVLRPSLGLVLDQAPIAVPDGALQAGHNFRISGGKLNNLNLGWDRFGTFTLGRKAAGVFTAAPVTLIYSHFDRDGTQQLIFGTGSDLYRYVDDDAVVYLTPRYATGTVAVSSANPAVVTGTGTLWTSANVKAGDAIAFGADDEDDPNADWYEVDSVDSTTQLTLTTAVSGAPLSAQEYTIRRIFTGTLNTPWSAVTFLHEGSADEDLFIATNGLDNAVSWNGSPSVPASYIDATFKAKYLTVFKNQLIATAITENGEFLPAQMRNSRPGFPLDFTNGLASAFTVHDGHDEVFAPVPLGDSLVLYSQRHIVVADFVGDPFVYVLRTAVPNLGPLASRLVGDYGDYHTFIGPDGQYAFDGASVREIGQQVWRVALRQRDPARIVRAFSFFDEENGELLWALPLNGDANDDGPETAYSDAYLENVSEKGLKAPISVRALPFTTAGYYERQSTLTWDQIAETWEQLNFRWNDIFFEAAFPLILVGDARGGVYTLNTSQYGGGDLFSETWTGSNGAVWPTARWQTAETSGTSAVDIQGGAGRLVAQGGSSVYARAISTGLHLNDFDLTAELTLASGGTLNVDQFHGLSFRASGGWATSNWERVNGYTVGFSTFNGAQSLDLISNVDNVQTYLKSVTANFGTDPWNVRVLAVGAELKVKMWQGSEPNEWNIEVTNSDHAGGDLSIAARNGGDSGARTATWDNLDIDLPTALLTSFVRFGRRPTTDGRGRGLLARVYAFISRFTTGDLAVRSRFADSAQGPVVLADEQTMDQDLPEGGHFVSPFRVGRFYELEFGTAGHAWELAGYDVDLRPGGGR